MLFKLCTLCLVFVCAPLVLSAQETTTPPVKCEAPIVSSKDVDRKLKILSKPDPRFSQKEIVEHSNRQVVLGAIFCGSGEITNIKVLQGISDDIDAKCIEAVRKIRFTPAEKDGAKVSTALNLVYRLSVTRVH